VSLTERERAALSLEAKTILDRAASQNRATTSEEDSRFDSIMGVLGEHGGIANAEELVRSALSDEGQKVAHAATGQGSNKRSDPLRDAIESGETNIYAEWPNRGDETRAISDFADSGALYTTDFVSQLAVYQRTKSPWLDIATVMTVENGRPLNVPQLTSDLSTGTPGEGTAISPSDPTIGSAALTTVGYKTITLLSTESIEDAEYDISAAVAESAGRSIGLAVGSAFTSAILGGSGVNSAGTAVPAGGLGTATPAFVGYEDLLDLKYGRQSPYRQPGVWVMANGMVKHARKFRDGVGQYLWQNNLAAGQPETFDGNQVWEDPYLTYGSATKAVVFGDASAALLVKATPIRVFISPHQYASTDQVLVRCTGRFGLVVKDPTAMAYLISANS
jgi:HK97 family phage major capsid protein